jgi:hypothetical protein
VDGRVLRGKRASRAHFRTRRIAVSELADLLASKLPFRQAIEWRQSAADFVNHYFGNWPGAVLRYFDLTFGKRPKVEIRLCDLPATLLTLVFNSSIETCGAPLWKDYIAQIGDPGLRAGEIVALVKGGESIVGS